MPSENGNGPIQGRVRPDQWGQRTRWMDVFDGDHVPPAPWEVKPPEKPEFKRYGSSYEGKPPSDLARTIQEVQVAQDLDQADVAAELSERLGTEIKRGRIVGWLRGAMPGKGLDEEEIRGHLQKMLEEGGRQYGRRWVPAEEVQQTIEEWLERYGLDYKHFAGALGLKSNRVWTWLQGETSVREADWRDVQQRVENTLEPHYLKQREKWQDPAEEEQPEEQGGKQEGEEQQGGEKGKRGIMSRIRGK